MSDFQIVSDPLIRKFEKSGKDVGHQDGGGHLHVDFTGVVGWHLELEEDDNVIWRLVASNPGPRDVLAVRCEPFTFGPWEIMDALRVPAGSSGRLLKEWRAMNEDQFFFFLIDVGGSFVPMDGQGNNSTGHTNVENTVGHMEWHGSQEVHLEVRLKGVKVTKLAMGATG